VPASAAKALEEPPRHAVHRGQHDGVRPDQRRDVPRHLQQRRSLDGDDHQVLHAERCRFAVGAHRVGGGAARFHQP